MKILAIDTATEQCSVALALPDRTLARVVSTTRGHADLILPMVDEVMRESNLSLAALDALAFGRGPGSFTGVRIAVGVIQGLAYACGKPVIGISNLAAVAQQAAQVHRLSVGAEILVCMDARMQEVYWARYRLSPLGCELNGAERVAGPSDVQVDAAAIGIGVGTGWRAYPELGNRYPTLQIDDTLLPRAIEVAQLACVEFVAGRVTPAASAQPVYLRDQVVAQR